MTHSMLQEYPTEIGYITKASAGLPYAVRLCGMIFDKSGHTTYHYAARINYGSWNDTKQAIQTLNQDGQFRSVFGIAAFPTHKDTSTNELDMLYENKRALEITDEWIHGGEDYGIMLDGSWRDCYYLFCDNGFQRTRPKDIENSHAAGFAMWRCDHPVI